MPEIAYLDHNATAPVRPEVTEAVIDALRLGGNPSSVHGAGRAARRLVEEAREEVAALAEVPPGRVVFTSGGTEANNLALRGCGRRTVAVSAIEHDSVLAAVPAPVTIAVTAAGRVDLAELGRILDRAIGAETVLSVMAATNETGIIQPVEAAAAAATERGVLVHCDAVQVAGRSALGPLTRSVDLLSLSAHKIGGPPGVGALILGEGVTVTPLNRGGGQESGRRAGTENVPGIAGFGVAARIARAEAERFAKVAALRDRLEAAALAANGQAVAFGREQPRLANTTCIAMPGVASETQIMALDLAGVAVSAGAACSSGKVRRSHVLTAMGVPGALAECAIRVSLGLQSTDQDVDRFLQAWTGLSDRMGAAA